MQFILPRKAIRESAFQPARHDLAMFLRDHAGELVQVFREELRQLDDEIPEQSFFIDIKMVPLGDIILKAALRATQRFLLEEAAVDLAKPRRCLSRKWQGPAERWPGPEYPRRDSNAGHRLRRPVLYPAELRGH